MVIISILQITLEIEIFFSYSNQGVKLIHKFRNISSIEKAKKLMDYFSKSFIKLYGDSNQTFTFHCISKHLIDDAKKHGSLFAHFMFSLEGSLGHFKYSLNGTRGLDTQFIKSTEPLIDLIQIFYSV